MPPASWLRNVTETARCLLNAPETKLFSCLSEARLFFASTESDFQDSCPVYNRNSGDYVSLLFPLHYIPQWQSYFSLLYDCFEHEWTTKKDVSKTQAEAVHHASSSGCWKKWTKRSQPTTCGSITPGLRGCMRQFQITIFFLHLSCSASQRKEEQVTSSKFHRKM